MILGFAMLSLSLLVEPGGLTAEDALSRIRAARKGGDRAPAVVTVRGRNVLSRTICFTAEDHDIAFVGEPGASFSGGLRLSGWRDLGRGVWETEAPQTESGETAFFDQLWVDGRRAPNARLPDEGWLEFSSATQIVAAAGSGVKHVERVTFADERTTALARVPKEDYPWLRVGVICKWAYGQRTLDGYDPGTRTVTTLTDLPWKAWKRWQPDNSLVAFFNVRSAFDAPGEWFLDRKAGKVRYRPRAGENPSAAEIVVPRPGLVRLLSFKADWARGECVRGISFRGIAFEHAASETDGNCPRQIDQLQAASAMDGMVSLEGVRGISFDGCRFAHCAGYGLRFHSACTSNRVTNCRITDPGAGGIWMGADYVWKDTRGEIGRKVLAPVRPDAVAFNVVSNCVISGGGRYNPEGVGICLSHCSDTRIVHNDIHDCMYSGISVGWTWGFSGSVSQRNDIGFNRIWDLGKGVMSDLGGVYTLGTSFGTVVHDNVIHDVTSRAYGGWGLYCDEGSEGIVEERNLCWNTDDGGFHQHYGVGCVIRNNIFAFNRRQGAVRMKRDVVDGVTCSLHFVTNIVYGGSGPLVGEGVRRVAGTWSNNLWYDVRGHSAAEFDGLGWEAWAACGKETGGVFADPLFADPARGDFTLKPGSPALALGFRPFDTSAAGAVDSTDAEARPAVDASPDRVKYRLTPGVYLTTPGVDGGSWLPAKPPKGLAGGECMKFVGTIRPRDANEVGAANWVICPGAPERGFSRWEEQRDYIRPLGIKFLRVQVSWAKTEPEKGKFDFAWLDDIVDYCEKNGISPIFETSYGNPIHEGGGGATLRGKFPSGDGLLLWDDWVDRLTKRYGGRVKEWAGWNEPDMGNFAYNSIEDVAAFALRTAKIIRRNVPDAKIAGLSLAGCDPKHIDRLLELTGPEGLRIYDSIIYHGYKANPESQYDFVEGIRLAVARRAPHLVLWQGENGCPSESDDNGALAFYEWNELSQAKWDMRRMLGDFARGIRCSLFVLTDFQRPGCRTQNHKGLLRIDGDLCTVGIKTAYYAAQNVVSVFDSEVRVLPSRPTCGRTDMELFAFERKGKPILAFWQNNGRKDPPDGAIVHLGSALTLYWQDERTFEDPVWVDLLSGRVYEFPKRYILREGGFNIVNLLPLIDSPCLLAERAALEMISNP